MKNWKNCVLIGLVAIIVLGFGFIGCKSDPEQKVKKTYLVHAT
jgi:hypothetical protein